MTPRQLVAFENPCARANDTINRQFHRAVVTRSGLVSTLLSLNK